MLGISHIDLIKIVQSFKTAGIIILIGLIILRECGVNGGFGMIVLSLTIISICMVASKSTDIKKDA